MAVIGSAYVNIRAITTELERDVRKTIEQIKNSVTINVGADVTAATAKIDELAASVRDETVEVTADTTAARAEIDSMADDIGGRSVGLGVDVHDVLARARLAILTRARTLRINVIANSGPVIALGNALGRLSGIRVAADQAERLVREFANIDKAVPKIAKLSTLFGTLAGVIMSSVGGLLTLGASLGSIIKMVGVAAPGMITGFAFGIGTLIVALKDFSKQLPEVTAQYKSLGAVIKGNYWEVARDAVRDMAQTLFPQFREGLTGTSQALGRWSVSLSNALKNSLGNGVIVGMFGNLNKSIDIAAKGIEPFVAALVEIGYVGGEYLPKLAQWFADVSQRFGDFIALSSDNGDLYRWMDAGIFNLQRLGHLIGEVSGFLGGLTEAARIAGSDGLGTLIRNFERMNDAVNSPDGLQKLSTIFEGTNAVASAFGESVYKIFGAFGNASEALKSSFTSIAGTLDVVSTALADIISNPEFQKGMTEMFAGIEDGAGKLFSVIGTTGPKLGALLSIIGNLASNLGGILGAALEVTLPLITAFKQAVDPLIPILGDALIEIIKELGPTFEFLAKIMSDMAPIVSSVVKVVADLVVGLVDKLGPNLPAIAGTLLAVSAAFTAFKVASAIGGVLSAVVSGIKGTIMLFTFLKSTVGLATAAQTAFTVAMNIAKVAFLANPIGIIVAALVALVAGFVLAYNNIGWFKDGVDAAMKFVSEAVGNVVSFWNTDVVPMFEAATKAAGEFFEGIGRFVDEALTNIGNFFNGFGDGVASVGGFFDDIGAGISGAFDDVVSTVTGVLDSIGAGISAGLTVITDIWTTGFNAVADVFTNIWNGIVWFFEPMINLIRVIIESAIAIIIAFWTAAWDIISTIFIGIWVNLVRFFTPIIESIRLTIDAFVTGVQTVWNTVWQTVSDFFTSVWNGLVAFITPIVDGIRIVIETSVNAIRDTWTAVWQGIIDFFTLAWNTLVAIYTPILQGIWDTIVMVVTAISDTWNSVWQAISDFFTGVWNGIVAFVAPIVQSLSDTITNVVNAISSFWNTTWTNIGNYISSVWSGIVGAVSGFVGQVQTNVTNFLNDVGRIGSDILQKVSNFPGLLLQKGRDLINGLAQGIQEATGNVLQKIADLSSSITNGLKDFFQIKSPSRVMRDQVGKQIGAGLAIGIEQSVGRVRKATETLSKAAMMDIPDINLPSIRQGSALSGSAPALSRAAVFDSSAQQSSGSFQPFAGRSGAVTNVEFNVRPSQGLSEEQIGQAAMSELYWQLASR